MKTRTLLALLAILVLLPAAAAMGEKAEKEQEPEGEQPKELSNTQIASCLVKITCDPSVLPLNFATVGRLLRSSGVRGKAAREILEIPLLSNQSMEMVHLQIDPLSEEPEEKRKEVAFDEEAEFEREMRAAGLKIQPTPMRGGPTYAAEQTLFFRLEVALAKDIKPAAEEFMKALLDNLRKTLDAACDHHRTKLDQRMSLAHDYAMHAKANLTGVQEKLREILGSYNLERQAILDDITRLRKEFQAADMEVRTSDAFVKATSKRIAETEKKMMNKLANDAVLAELQKIIGMHEERLKTLVNKAAPEPETSQARENLARARIELAQRREQVSQSAGAELINSLRNQISELTIQQVQALKRMSMLDNQLQEARDLLPKVDEYERISLELKIARDALEEALLLHSRLKRKSFLSLLIQPSVLVLGAD